MIVFWFGILKSGCIILVNKVFISLSRLKFNNNGNNNFVKINIENNMGNKLFNINVLVLLEIIIFGFCFV